MNKSLILGKFLEEAAATAISVGPASSSNGPIEPEPIPLITTEVAIIATVAVIAVVGVVAFWALRKRG